MSATSPEPDSDVTLESGSWVLDPADSLVEFVSRTMWGAVAVRGSFSEYEGILDLSASPAIRLTIVASSIDTKNPKRDEHLRSADFFGVDAGRRWALGVAGADGSPRSGRRRL